MPLFSYLGRLLVPLTKNLKFLITSHSTPYRLCRKMHKHEGEISPDMKSLLFCWIYYLLIPKTKQHVCRGQSETITYKDDKIIRCFWGLITLITVIDFCAVYQMSGYEVISINNHICNVLPKEENIGRNRLHIHNHLEPSKCAHN